MIEVVPQGVGRPLHCAHPSYTDTTCLATYLRGSVEEPEGLCRTKFAMHEDVVALLNLMCVCSPLFGRGWCDTRRAELSWVSL